MTTTEGRCFVLESTPTLINSTDAASPSPIDAANAAPQWGLLTKHGRLLALLTQHTDLRIKDIAELLGTTQRTAQIILGELIEAGVVARTKVGRRNTYRVGAPRAGEVRRALERDLRAITEVLVALAPRPTKPEGRPPSTDPAGPASAA